MLDAVMGRVAARFPAFAVFHLPVSVLFACSGATPSDDGIDGAGGASAGGGESPSSTGGLPAHEPTSSGGATGGTEPGDGGGEAAGASGGAQGTGGARVGEPPDPGTIDCRQDGDGKTTLVFVNGCPEALTYRGSDIEGGVIQAGGFECVDIGSDVEPINSKRYWGFIGEDPGAERHTLAEFTFNTDFYDFDWYNISHVDAHNLPMQIVPVERPDCDPVTCEESWLESCPDVGKVRSAEGVVISCVSPDRDDSQSEVALFFEACDDAYAWSGDDQEGDEPSPMHACAGEDWDIVFCPEAE